MLPLRPSRQEPNEEPIRAELFGIERLEQHAESLAIAQRVTGGSKHGHPLLSRVEANGRVLRDANRAIAGAIQEKRWITPAAEWLVDNFFVVDEQLREIRDDLPVGYYRELPKLADGPLAGYPRVYGIAWAFVAHTDSGVDPETLRLFVRAYQRVQPLTIGELWAVPITLRVVLVENLRRMADLVDEARRADSDFAAMDFVSRDSYRHAVEALARGSKRSELDITREALAQAARARARPPGEVGERDARWTDPGFYLVGDGRRD